MLKQGITLQHHKVLFLSVIVFSMVIGFSLALKPLLAWLLIVVLITFTLLQFPPFWIATSAVVATLFSRLLVAWGIAPGIINFMHFPLAILAILLAFLSTSGGSSNVPLSKRLLVGLGTFSVLTLLSWLASGGEFLKALLTWLLFAEPFLLIVAIVKTIPRDKAPILAKLILGLVIVQIPFAFSQVATLGIGDVVQGTLIGQGAGAHIVGAIALMAVIALSTNYLFGYGNVLQLLAIPLLFAIPVLADAKQSIVAFVPAILISLLGSKKLNIRAVLITATAVIMIVVAGYFYPPLGRILNLDLILAGLEGKILAYRIVTDKMSEFPPTFLIGLGPGHSVSRASLAAQEGYIRSLPKGWIEIILSPITTDILLATAGSYLFASSSVWSGVSSWLGLFGDLGLLGVSIYLWLLWVVWRGFGDRASPWTYTGKAVLLMGVILGWMFSWLETPEFTLPWALFISIGLVDYT